PHLVFRRAVRRLAGGTGTLGRHLLRDVRYHRRINAEEVGDQRDDDPAHAQTAADHADAAPVLDVVACALVFESHLHPGGAGFVPADSGMKNSGYGRRPDYRIKVDRTWPSCASSTKTSPTSRRPSTIRTRCATR